MIGSTGRVPWNLSGAASVQAAFAVADATGGIAAC